MDGNKISVFVKEKKIFIIAGLAIILIAVALAYFFNDSFREADEPDKEPDKKEDILGEALDETVNYYRNYRPALSSWWELVALYGAGADLSEEPWDLKKWDTLEVGPGMGATEYAGVIFTLMVLGETEALAHDIHSPVVYLLELQDEDGGFGGGINNTVWAVIALDCVSPDSFNADMRHRAMDYLAGMQHEDGGFSYSGDSGDPDMTAMTLQALATLVDIDGVAAVMNDAVVFLRRSYEESGYFASYGQANVNSIAAVISGLTSAGEDVFSFGREVSEEDVSNEVNEEHNYGLVSELLEYRMADGSFAFLTEQEKGDPMATVQSLIALGDAYFGETVFSRLSESFSSQRTGENSGEDTAEDESDGTEGESNDDEGAEDDGAGASPGNGGRDATVEEDGGRDSAGETGDKKNGEGDEPPDSSHPPADSNEDTAQDDKKDDDLIRVSLKVVGSDRNYYDGTVSFPINGSKTPVDVLRLAGLSYSTLYDGIYVSELMGEKEDLSSGAGWKFKVNGVIPSIAAGHYTVKNNDRIVWWYAQDPSSTGP